MHNIVTYILYQNQTDKQYIELKYTIDNNTSSVILYVIITSTVHDTLCSPADRRYL